MKDFERNRLQGHPQIDSIQNRARNPSRVSFSLPNSTTTPYPLPDSHSTRAGVHRRHQYEIGGKPYRLQSSIEPNFSRLQRLAKTFQTSPLELDDLIEK
tara:strand:- start:204 stop:500 length:297 start_codon:yes stop_codon:yes gene_type:complete